ncbi:MAG: exodeoxyribonuclease VII small subunit [Firmicutes bacterium]|nr:exodeoxyribonuclease VII small subunit [Bacillota bacterium]HAL63824.1 exodeoxyribonuclease VII small subunit [Clostridiales bacterium]
MFEKAIKELEEVVNKLESGEASLSESLELFEKGIKLAGDCNKMLDEAEKKVSVLIGGEKKDFDEE